MPIKISENNKNTENNNKKVNSYNIKNTEYSTLGPDPPLPYLQ